MKPMKYAIGDIVYHAVSWKPGLVTGILLRSGYQVYLVTWDDFIERYHSDGELMTDDELMGRYNGTDQ